MTYVWYRLQRNGRRVYQFWFVHGPAMRLLGTITFLGRKQYGITRQIFSDTVPLLQLTNLSEAKAYLLGVVRILK